jgi:hypothetical protein
MSSRRFDAGQAGWSRLLRRVALLALPLMVVGCGVISLPQAGHAGPSPATDPADVTINPDAAKLANDKLAADDDGCHLLTTQDFNQYFSAPAGTGSQGSCRWGPFQIRASYHTSGEITDLVGGSGVDANGYVVEMTRTDFEGRTVWLTSSPGGCSVVVFRRDGAVVQAQYDATQEVNCFYFVKLANLALDRMPPVQ